MRIFMFLLCGLAVIGCSSSKDSRVHLRDSVKSDNLVDNYVTRPVAAAFSALLGEGIVVDEAIVRRNESGFFELYVKGFNKSYSTKKFRYRVEWLDENGLPIETKTSVWLPMSAMGKQTFSFKVVAPRNNAMDFRMDTRKWE